MNRKRYSESYKSEAVKLVREQGRSVMQASQELGISDSCLRRWIEADDIEKGNREGMTATERAEIRDLRREVQILRMERDILKKATAFFAKES